MHLPCLLSNSLSLERFAQASNDILTSSDSKAFAAYTLSLAAITDIDVVLLYDYVPRSSTLNLLAASGLAADDSAKLKSLSSAQAGANDGHLLGKPWTSAPAGVRAWCAYPMWSDGILRGQLVVRNRQSDEFSETAQAVLVSATSLIAHALARRENTSEAARPTSQEDGVDTVISKRRQFIAVLAHELRNPVAPIRSGLDLLSTGLMDVEGQRTTLAMMQRQVKHLVRLIDDLLDTVRLDTGRLQVKREPIMLQEVVRSAIESIRPALASKHQALKLDDAAAAVVVDVDPVRLSQAFVNILNANVKQTSEGGIIAVLVQSDASRLTITFEDESGARTAEEIHNVFELFPTNAEQKSAEGWGIGLALVKGLIELNDGHVELHNRESSNGAVYTVTLPRAHIDPEAVASSLPSKDGSSSAWASRRILIVDDNRDAADTLALLFELDGNTARVAYDGPSAVTEAREFQPEVILMDIGLPGFDGNEATRRIRFARPEVDPFIIALTGWGDGVDRDATQAAGCNMHFVKPVAHELLRQTILERNRGQAKEQRLV